MKLFKFEEYKLKISEEALAIKAFRDIWERDKSKTKGKAIQELSYIYFFCDPRSDYMFLVDEDTRSAKIKEQEGLEDDWKPDAKIKNAMEVYKYLTQSTGTLLLQDTRELIDKMRAQLKEMDLSAVDKNGKPVYTLNMVTSTIKLIPGLLRDLSEAEKAVNAEVEEAAEARGDAVKHLFEDGFNFQQQTDADFEQ